MSITVLDSYSAMRRILLAPVADRADLLRSMLEPIRDMLVDTYLAATGQTAAQALRADSSEIIATTLRRG